MVRNWPTSVHISVHLCSQQTLTGPLVERLHCGSLSSKSWKSSREGRRCKELAKAATQIGIKRKAGGMAGEGGHSASVGGEGAVSRVPYTKAVTAKTIQCARAPVWGGGS